MNPKIKANILLFLANLIYAGNYTVAKIVMPEYIKPFGFILLRVSTGLILFWLLLKGLKLQIPEKKDWPLLALCGLFGVATNQLLFFVGLSKTTPINAALIMTTTPILVLIVSAIILNEKITARKILGISIGAIGAIILILQGKQMVEQSSTWIGNLFIFGNATSYGIYLVIVKPLMKKYHPVTVITMVFTFGWIFVIPFGINEASQIEWHTFSSGVWLATLYVLIFVTFFAYLFNSAALKELEPTVVSTYIYLQPLLATIIALLAAKDSIDSVKLLAGVLIFVGVYLVIYNKKTISVSNKLD